MTTNGCQDIPLRTRRWRRSGIGALLLAVTAAPLVAQVPDSTKKRADADTLARANQQARQIVNQAHVVRLWEVGAVLGGAALVSLLDQPLERSFQRDRSPFLTDLSSVFRQQGEPWYYVSVSVGVWGAGVIANSHDLRRAGRRLMAAVAVSGLTEQVIKQLVGRARPNEGSGAFTFHPFSSLKDSLGVQTRGSFPSGHATAAFAVATSLADDIRNPFATAALYTLAAGAAWSRIYDNRHWLSDTFVGAALGITTAKVISGRWRVFGWRPPSLLVRPTGEVALRWTLPLNPIHAF